MKAIGFNAPWWAILGSHHSTADVMQVRMKIWYRSFLMAMPISFILLHTLAAFGSGGVVVTTAVTAVAWFIGISLAKVWVSKFWPDLYAKAASQAEETQFFGMDPTPDEVAAQQITILTILLVAYVLMRDVIK